MLKRSPSLVEQVKAHLKQRIINAEFDSGRIPSESDLAGELGVSRNTVRDALSRLAMEGVIFRKQGAGTFVNQAILLIKTRLEEIVPYKTLIQEHGYTSSIQLISIDEKSVDPKTQTRLHLDPNETILVTQKLFLADNEPVIFTITHIPTKLIKHSYTHDDIQQPIYEFLPNYCQQDMAYYLSEIVPIVAPDWLVDRLNLPQPQTALLSFEEIGHNQKNEPLVQATSYFRDDLLRLRLMRRYQ